MVDVKHCIEPKGVSPSSSIQIMVASELHRQLSQHRETGGVLTKNIPGSGKGKGLPSILYEPKDASWIDTNELRHRAQECYDILVSTIDPDLSQINLFKPSRTTASWLLKKRGFLTSTESKEADELINRFIFRIGSYWQDENALNCLEYLVRQYSIQRYNVNALLAMCLPYHDTPLFVQIVRILELECNSPFLFLDGVQKTLTPLKRSTFVQNCIRETALLKFLGDAVEKSSIELERPNIPLISFFTVVVIEVISSPNFRTSEKSIRQIIPVLFFALNNPSLRELHIGALCILTQLSQRASLTRETCIAVVVDLFHGILKSINSLTRKQIALTEALMFTNLLIVGQMNSKQKNGVVLIPSTILNLLCKSLHFDDVISSIYDIESYRGVDMAPFIGCLYRSIFYRLESPTKSKVRNSLLKFSTEFIQRGAGDRSSRLSSKSRIAICLAAFDIICASESMEKVSTYCSPALRVLEDLYPTSTAAALRHVVEFRDTPSTAIARIINVLSTTLSGFATAPMPGICSDVMAGDMSQSFSIWTAMADPNPKVRLEAVGVALSRLEDFFKSDAGSGIKHTGLPSGIRLLFDVLLDRSSDRHLPIAKLVLSNRLLWTRAPPCVSLSSLFQQLYLIIERLITTDPWNIKALQINENIVQLTDVIILLLSSSSQLLHRFTLLIETLRIVLSSCPNRVIADTFDQLSPILLPIAWSLSDFQNCSNEVLKPLHDALVTLFKIFDEGLQVDAPFVENSEKKEKISSSNRFLVLSRKRIMSSLISYDLPCEVISVNDSEEDVSRWRIGPITVISYEQESASCPTVETLNGWFLGGIWPFLGRIEAITEVMDISKENTEVSFLSIDKLNDTLRLSMKIWSSARSIYQKDNHDNSNENSGMIVCRRMMKRFVLRLVKRYSSNQELVRSAISLGICNIIEELEELVSIMPFSNLVALFSELLAKSDSAGLPSSLLPIARSTSANLLKEIINSDVGVNVNSNSTNWVRLLSGPVLIGLCDGDNQVQYSCLDLAKRLRKTPNKKTYDNSDGWNGLLVIPTSNELSQFESIFTSFDLRIFFKLVVKKISSDISLGKVAAIKSLQSLISSNEAAAQFLGVLSTMLHSKSPEGSLVLLGLLNEVDFSSIAVPICIPVWEACLLGDQYEPLRRVGHCFTKTLETSKNNEHAKPPLKAIWTKVIKPFCKANESIPNSARHMLFLQLLKSLLNADVFDLFEKQSHLLKLLTNMAVKWGLLEEGGKECTGHEQSLPRSLAALMRDVGAAKFSPALWVERLHNYGSITEKMNEVRELVLIIECLTINIDKRREEWKESECVQLIQSLTQKMKFTCDPCDISITTNENRSEEEEIYGPREIRTQHLLVIISILRCIRQVVSLGLNNEREAIFKSVKTCIQKSAEFIDMHCGKTNSKSEIKTQRRVFEAFVGPLLDLISELAIGWSNEPSSASNEVSNLSTQVKIDELFEAFINTILAPYLKFDPYHFLNSPSLVTSIQSTVPKIINSCLPNDTTEQRHVIQQRSLSLINSVAPGIVAEHIRRCFSSLVEGQVLSEDRILLEKKKLQKKIIVLTKALDEDSTAIASLVFLVIYCWSRITYDMRITSQKKRGNESDTENEGTQPGERVTEERWIIELCCSVLQTVKNSNRTICQLCTIGFAELPQILKSKKKYKYRENTAQPTLSRAEDINLFHRLSLLTAIEKTSCESMSSYFPKSLYISFKVIQRYLQVVGCPSLDDPDTLIQLGGKNDDVLKVDENKDRSNVSYQSSIEAEWVSELLEVFLLTSFYLKQAQGVTSEFLPVISLVNELGIGIINSSGFLLGSFQLIHQSFTSHVHPIVIEDLLDRIRLCHFVPRLTPIVTEKKSIKNEQKSERRKKRKSAKSDDAIEDEEEPFSPLSNREITNVKKVEPFVSSTVSFITTLCITNTISSEKKNTDKSSSPSTSITSRSASAALFLSDLILVSGNAFPTIFETFWISQISDQIASFSQNFSLGSPKKSRKSAVEFSKTDEAFLFALCRNIFSMAKAMPSHSYLPHLNSIMDSLMSVAELLTPQVSSSISSPPQSHYLSVLRCVFLTLTSFFCLPSRHYLSHHLPRIVDSILVNPIIITHIVLPDSSNVFSSIFEVLRLIAHPKLPITIDAVRSAVSINWLSMNTEMPLVTSSSDCNISKLSGLWRHLFYLIATTSPLRSIVSSLQSKSKALANQIATAVGTNIIMSDEITEENAFPELRMASSLTLLSIALRSGTAENVELYHKEISALILTAIHSACSHVELVVTKLKENKQHNQISELLSVDVQSGVVESLFYSSREKARLSHPSSIIDISNPTVWSSRTFGLLEASICLAFQSWLPKMTNSHLQPFLKTLLRYCRRNNELLMSQIENDKTATEELADRDAAGARLFILLFSIVAIELGDIGIVGCLMNIIHDINQILIRTTKDAFKRSMTEGQRQATTSKKSRKAVTSRMLTTSSSWWWCDLNLPTLHCLASCSLAITTQTSTSNSALVEVVINALIETVDLFAIVQQAHYLENDEEDEEKYQTMISTSSLSDHILFGCQNAFNKLVGSVAGDQIQLQRVIHRLLEKIQGAKNSSVKLGSLQILIYLWNNQQLALLPTLSDSLQVFAELLEDHDEEVEKVSRRLIQIIEGITGESLESRLCQ